MIPSRATLTALALLSVLIFAGCGGGGGADAPDTDDPVDVAIAYYRAWWGCKDEGSARRWDLRAASYITREEALEEDQEGGCVPERPPEVVGNIAAEQGEQVAVTLRAPSDAGIEQDLILVRLEGQWKVEDDGGQPEGARRWAASESEPDPERESSPDVRGDPGAFQDLPPSDAP